MLDVPKRIAAWLAGPAAPPFPGVEYVKGWGVFALPLDSGHVLGLRVFPQGTFEPYRSLWHRDPAGRWSIHVDGPRIETACPRYYGPALDHAGFARIDVEWTGPTSLRVTMDEPRLAWTLDVRRTAVLRMLNATAPLMPTASWRPRALLWPREQMARALGMGRIELSGRTPSGHLGTSMPQEMYFVDDALVTLDGADLGRPAQLPDTPFVGEASLPRRGVVSIGQACWQPLPVEVPQP